MIATLFLALATLPPPTTEVVQLDENCRLVRQVAKVPSPHARPTHTAAPKPRAKPRRRLYRTDPTPAEEVICDDVASAPLSVLPTEPTPELTPVPPESFARLSTYELLPPLVEPPPIAYDDAPLGPSSVVIVASGYPAAPVFALQPPLIAVAPIPEPSTWMLLALGGVALTRLRRPR